MTDPRHHSFSMTIWSEFWGSKRWGQAFYCCFRQAVFFWVGGGN